MRQVPIIMVAIDFSEHALAALSYAHQLARKLDATLILVNVFNERDIRAIQYAKVLQIGRKHHVWIVN